MEKLKPKLFSVMKTYTREHRKKASTLRSQQALSSLFWAEAASRSQVRLQHLQRSSPELLQKTA